MEKNCTCNSRTVDETFNNVIHSTDCPQYMIPEMSNSELELLIEILKHQKEIVSNPLRFNGVSVEDIKRIFKERGTEIHIDF